MTLNLSAEEYMNYGMHHARGRKNIRGSKLKHSTFDEPRNNSEAQDQHDKVKRKALLAPDNARTAIASGLNPHSRPQFDNPAISRQPVGNVDVGAVIGGMEATGVIPWAFFKLPLSQ